MKALKYSAYAVIALVLLAVLALLAAVFVVDGAFVKAQLQRYMSDRQRTLTIEGDPRIRLFPVAGISLGRTTLTEPGGNEPFLSFDSVEAAVRVAPLFAGAVAIELVSAKALRVHVHVRKDGHMNFDDLETRGATPVSESGAPERRGPPRLAVRQVDVEGAALFYTNDITGQQLELGDVALSLGPLADAVPSPLTMTAKLVGRDPDMGITAQASGLVKLDLSRESLAFQKIDARVNGNAGDWKGVDVRLSGGIAADARKGELQLEGLQLTASATREHDALTARLSAPRISVTRERAGGSALTVAIRLVGPERRIDGRLDVAAAEGSYASLTLPSVDLSLDAAQDGGSMKLGVKTLVHANLDSGIFELPKLIADLYVSHPRLPQKSFRLPIEASMKADRGKQTLSARASANAEDFDFKLQFDARHLAPLDAKFDFSSQRLNLDRYPLEAAAGKGGGDDRVDLSGLIGPSLNGKIRIGALQVGGARLADVAADVRLEHGALNLAPHSARLYGGTLAGSVAVNARARQVSVKENLQNVQINPLLRDLVQKDILEGRGDIQLDVSGSGATLSAMKRSLAGSARIQLRDGAYKGINLEQIFRRAQAALSGRSLPADVAQKTDFTELAASFTIKGGVAHNDDLVLKSPFLRAEGSGDLDVAAATLDYVVKPLLVASAAGQQVSDKLAGITVPVRLHGPLDAIKYEVDARALASSQLRDRLGEELNKRLNPQPGGAGSKSGSDELRDQVRERLRGLLNR